MGWIPQQNLKKIVTMDYDENVPSFACLVEKNPEAVHLELWETCCEGRKGFLECLMLGHKRLVGILQSGLCGDDIAHVIKTSVGNTRAQSF